MVKTPNHTDIFFCLDTGGGTLGELQFDWFKNLLETERQQYRYCTVLTHDNLFRLRPTASTNPMPEENRVLSELFLKHNVNMVMAAHDHKRNTTVTGNTTHIMLDALQDDNKNASYVALTFDEAGIDFGFIEL
ncbi:metallophosphoesterase [Crocinitomicaceae bacterium]|nr:metallophosphoesterase [Crocinitomicaceae bacterium]